MPHLDTIIIGGGIVGASSADALLGKGQKVLLIEQFEPGHTHGSSHGDGRIIRFAYPEAIYVEMARLSYPGWETLAQRSGKRFVLPSGGWDCGPADSFHLAELESNFQQFGIPYERLSAEESNARFPQFRLAHGSAVIYQPDAGVVRASAAVLALWELIRAQGGMTVTGTRVERITLTSAQVTVTTADGTEWTAERLIVAAGGWAGKLLAQTNLQLPLVATEELVAFFPQSDEIDHRVGAMPVFIDYHQEASFYGLPQVDVPGVKVGWHHTGPVVDPDNPATPVTDPQFQARVDTLKQYVSERLPHLDSANPVQVLTCLYTNTPDYHFILDRHPAFPNVAIGAGFSGHGFKFAPVLGDVLAALALDEAPPVALETFAIARFDALDKLVRRTNA